MDSDKLNNEAKEISETWANFIKIDMSDGIKNVEESIEDTLTRLDEFTGVIDVLRRETKLEPAYTIIAKKAEIMLLFEKIRKLEKIVNTVKLTVENFEQVVTKAESDLDFTPEGKILNYIKPLFFKKRVPNRTRNDQTEVTYTSPDIYSTKDLFSS